MMMFAGPCLLVFLRHYLLRRKNDPRITHGRSFLNTLLCFMTIICEYQFQVWLPQHKLKSRRSAGGKASRAIIILAKTFDRRPSFWIHFTGPPKIDPLKETCILHHFCLCSGNEKEGKKLRFTDFQMEVKCFIVNAGFPSPVGKNPL